MRNKNILLLSLIIGVVAPLMTTMYLGNASKKKQYASQLIPVCVAKVDIPIKTKITAEMIDQKKVPREYIQPGSISKISEVIGKITLVPFVTGEQLSSTRISVVTNQMGLSIKIPVDKRAVSVEVDAAASIAQLIQPGDMVDVLCTLEEFNRTVTILQNIEILAIDQKMESTEKESGKVENQVIATFALTSSDAEKIVMASNKGRLRLVLRPVNDNKITQSGGVSPEQLLPYDAAAAKKVMAASEYSVNVYKGIAVDNKTVGGN
jgi:pilus assembly protein CpaB